MSTPFHLTAADLARRLHARRCGKGWSAKCPNHHDRRPSLSICEGRDGRTLLHCFAGCRTDDILRVLGADWTALFASEHRVRFANSQRARPVTTFRDLKREKYEQLRQLYRGAASRFRWFTKHVDAGELEWVSSWCDDERELDSLNAELCALERGATVLYGTDEISDPPTLKIPNSPQANELATADAMKEIADAMKEIADSFHETPKPNGSTREMTTAELLSHVYANLRRYFVLAETQMVVLSLWSLHTYVFTAARHTPYLRIFSPTSNAARAT